MKKKKELTTDDIAFATVYLIAKDGRVFVTNLTDKLSILNIAINNTFTELDSDKVANLNISELIKTKNDKNRTKKNDSCRCSENTGIRCQLGKVVESTLGKPTESAVQSACTQSSIESASDRHVA